MELNNNHKPSKRGGARPGAGRPHGTKNKISGQSILEEIEQHLGIPYAQQLVNNYADTIRSNDTNLRFQYDKLILGKVVADKADITITESEELIAQRRAAFADAIIAISNRTAASERPTIPATVRVK
jgi:hypothetical protein